MNKEKWPRLSQIVARWDRHTDNPKTLLLFERIRTIFLIVSLSLCSAIAGSSVGAEFLLQPRHHLKVNPLVSSTHISPVKTLQIESVPQGSSLQTAVALNTANIEQIIKQNQVSIDDRQQLHALIQSLAATEVNHYNILSDRMNVNDARVMTIGWILGVLFTLSQAIVVFFHLDKRRRPAMPQYEVAPPPAQLQYAAQQYSYQAPPPPPPQPSAPAPPVRRRRRS